MISLFLPNSGPSPLWSSPEQSQKLTHYLPGHRTRNKKLIEESKMVDG